MPQKNIERPVATRQRAAAHARKSTQHKKLIIASVLFLVMAVLWVRIFVIKGGPKTASAVTDINLNVTPLNTTVTDGIVYIDLPVTAGRQDVLANDLFAARNFKGFKKIGETTAQSEQDPADANVISGDLAAAAAELELEVIVNDKKPQVFIEDNLLEIGQSFRFPFHDQIYNFKVVKILADRIELECNGTIITKKIPESTFKEE